MNGKDPRVPLDAGHQGHRQNIADFGAFIDLGGIDGLLHITDMSWAGSTIPARCSKSIRRSRSRSSDRQGQGKDGSGPQQKDASPWENMRPSTLWARVPRGRGCQHLSYGAFVKLEEGVRVVHIAEMSWTKRINHPARWSAQQKVL